MPVKDQALTHLNWVHTQLKGTSHADQRIQDMILQPNLITAIIREQNKVLESKGLSSSSAWSKLNSILEKIIKKI